MTVKAKLKNARSILKEARERYQHEANRDLEKWDNEDAAHFQKRKEHHQFRVTHFDELVAHLKKKVEFLAKKVKDSKDEPDPDGDGLATYDGKTVAAWVVPWLDKSRKAGWSGVVVSGYRDPAYSEQLCYGMCGAPSCPGRCAGRSSNHSGKNYPAGAIDVSDYTNFEAVQFQIASPLRNDLPSDPVHFSVSGR